MIQSFFQSLPDELQVSTGELLYNSYNELYYKLTGAERKIINIHNEEMRYFTAGNPEKPCLIFLHGFSDAKESYLPLTNSLIDSYYIIVPDLIGFGKSSRPKIRYSISQYVRWVHEFLEKLNINNAYIMGNSMGGAILMELAVFYPSRIKSIALLNSAGLIMHSDSMNLYDLYLYGKNLFEIENDKDFDFFLSYLIYEPNKFPPPIKKHLYQKYTKNADWYTYLMHELLHDIVYSEEVKNIHHKNIKKINIKTHIIWGKEDKLLPLEIGLELNRLIPNSTLKIFENVGHAPHMEVPDRLSDYIRLIF